MEFRKDFFGAVHQLPISMKAADRSDRTGDFSRRKKDSFWLYKKCCESNGEDLEQGLC